MYRYDPIAPSAIAGHVRSLDEYLATLSLRWGRWRLVASGESIEFDSTATRDAYRTAMDRTLATQGELRRTLSLWNARRLGKPGGTAP